MILGSWVVALFPMCKNTDELRGRITYISMQKTCMFGKMSVADNKNTKTYICQEL